MIILNKAQILSLHEQLIKKFGGSSGLRDEGLLESAIAAAYQCFEDVEFFPTVEEKAAKLAYGLIKNHAFIDGNKRIGAAAMLVLLDLNDVSLKYMQADLYSLIIAVASGNSNYDDLYAWIVNARDANVLNR